MPTGSLSASWPACLRGLAEQIDERRETRSGMPPMMASAMGRPSVPARIADGGLPPTATQIGILFGVRG